jgi:aspartyl-tRNA(Asn)/glutamyl-tRNA(Gln) amidotransferase subunit C
MKLTKDQVQKIANLAKLKLSDEEVEKYSNQLSDILTWVEVLKEVDTSGVKETNQVTGLTNIVRPDLVKQDLASPDELLECSPLPKEKHQIKIKRII